MSVLTIATAKSSIPETVLSYPNGYVNLGNHDDDTSIYGKNFSVDASDQNYGGMSSNSYLNLTKDTFGIGHSYDDPYGIGLSGGFYINGSEQSLFLDWNKYNYAEANSQSAYINLNQNGSYFGYVGYDTSATIQVGGADYGYQTINLQADYITANGNNLLGLFNGSEGYTAGTNFANSAASAGYADYADNAGYAMNASSSFNVSYIPVTGLSTLSPDSNPLIMDSYSGNMYPITKADFASWIGAGLLNSDQTYYDDIGLQGDLFTFTPQNWLSNSYSDGYNYTSNYITFTNNGLFIGSNLGVTVQNLVLTSLTLPNLSDVWLQDVALNLLEFLDGRYQKK